jgi:uncharacterized protein YjiS (DUF1127 family)
MNLTHSARLHGPDRHHIGRAAWRDQFRTGLARLAAVWAERRKLAHNRRILTDFSDRQLRDIGISRSDIPAVLVGTFHRD